MLVNSFTINMKNRKYEPLLMVGLCDLCTPLANGEEVVGISVVGTRVGFKDGEPVGWMEGYEEGIFVGSRDGLADGASNGWLVG